MQIQIRNIREKDKTEKYKITTDDIESSSDDDTEEEDFQETSE